MDSFIGIMKDFVSCYFTMFQFYTSPSPSLRPGIIRATFGFLMFSGSTKRDYWKEMGKNVSFLCYYLENLKAVLFKEQLSVTASGFLNRLKGIPVT